MKDRPHAVTEAGAGPWERSPCLQGNSKMYQPRFYRSWTSDRDLVSFSVVLKETDLQILARRNLRRKAEREVLKYRGALEAYVARHPQFLSSLTPVAVGEDSPRVVRTMAEAAYATGVGPMAAVAGAIAEYVGRQLLPFSREVIVENGGDIFMSTQHRRLVGIYAGDSPFTNNLALEIQPGDTPLGICTSSGTVGHSLSLGQADACIAVSASTALADAAATAVGNLIQTACDISQGIEFARSLRGLKGVLIIKDDRIGMWGDVTVVALGEQD